MKKGFKHNEETKQRMRLAKIGDKNPAKRPEVREKLSKSLKKFNEENPNFIKNVFSNPELRQKISSNSTKQWKDEEKRKRILDGLRKAHQDPKFKEKLSKHALKNWSNPEVRKRMLESISKVWSNPENRKRLSESVIKRMQIHSNFIQEQAKILESQGFKVLISDKIRPDIISFKDGKIYAVEIELGAPNYEKYKECKFFDDIIWVLRKTKTGMIKHA